MLSQSLGDDSAGLAESWPHGQVAGSMAHTVPIPDNRPLTAHEASLVQWLHEHGTSAAMAYLGQLEEASVVSRCPCGCASIDLAVRGAIPPTGAGMQVLSDYVWQDANGNRFGTFVFARAGVLAGLEVWSVDGLAAASALPLVEQLQPLAAW
jgi:hypothetical protein